MGFATLIRIGLRDLRGARRHLSIFFLCLMLGIAAMSAISLSLRAAEEGISRNARALAGGDLVVRTLYVPLAPKAHAYLSRQGTFSETISLRTMASARDSRQLIELKAVDDAYPLAGELRFSPSLPRSRLFKQAGDLYGGIAEPLLFDRLGVKPGDVISVGSIKVQLRAALTHEPDRFSGSYNLGPRVIISKEALAASGLMQFGSLATFRSAVLLPKGTSAAPIKAELLKTYDDGSYDITLTEDAAPGLKRSIDRLGLFLGFAALLSCLIGAIGITNAVRAYFTGRALSIARLKCIGATNGIIFSIYLFQVTLVALTAIAAGLVLGAGGQYLLLWKFGGMLPAAPVPGLYALPIGINAAFGLLLSLGVSLPWLWNAERVHPAALLRSALSHELPLRFTLPQAGLLMLFAAGLVQLTVLYTDNLRFSLFFLSCAAASFVCFFLVASMIRRMASLLASPSRRAFFSPSWRLSVANLGRRGSITGIFLISFGLGLTMLIALTLVAANFHLQLTYERPQNAPSFFLLDVPPEKKVEMSGSLTPIQGFESIEYMPMLRGKITALNGAPLDANKVDPGAQWVLRSDRGITYSATPPEGSTIKEGAWWPADYAGPPLVSFGDELAKGLGLTIGDTMTINVAGNNVTATVANLRQIEWSTLQMNFAIVLSPGAFANLPVSELATVHARPEAEASILRLLSEKYPEVTAVYLKETLAEAARLFESVSWIVLGIAGLSIVMGVLVIASALRATLERRLQESVILYVLGQSRAAVKSLLKREILLLTGVTILLSLGLGTVIASLLMKRMLLPTMLIPWQIPALGALLSLFFALLLVYGFARGLAAARPLSLLRNE